MMKAEELIQLSAPSSTSPGNNNAPNSNNECDTGSQHSFNMEENALNLSNGRGDTGVEEGQIIERIEFESIEVDSQLVLQERREMNSGVSLKVTTGIEKQDDFLTPQDESAIKKCRMDSNQFVGAKRARMEFDSQSPSINVIYNSLTRKSLQKLEEVLQNWSRWHAQNVSSSHDPDEILECGEEMYFPALHTGSESSSVSFWMDNQLSREQNPQTISVDGPSAPLYDRGYALGLNSDDVSGNAEGRVEIFEDASRCFNCGSYGHALKECQKPRDTVAINSARKQHNLKHNLSAGSRNQARYYQDSPGGKFDGLKPGVLDSGTRKLLGLKELDPPPWLNRMREIGYPPGYLDPDIDDDPSGITIFSDSESKKEEVVLEVLKIRSRNGEDGEFIPDMPKKKMSVEFPGINSPIPENADKRRWAPPNHEMTSGGSYGQSPLSGHGGSSFSSHGSQPHSSYLVGRVLPRAPYYGLPGFEFASPESRFSRSPNYGSPNYGRR